MKKFLVLFTVLAASLCFFLASCDEMEDAFTGWNYVGEASSKSNCEKKVKNAGYYYFLYDEDTNHCYGKN